MRNLEILGSGIYLPATRVTSLDLDNKLGLTAGSIEGKTGVRVRHYAKTETASDMAVEAIKQAVNTANIELDDIDCLIAASGTMEQAIPCNAAKILAALNFPKPIAGFDINATCLSALVAIDLASSLLASGQYQRIAVVSSDIASPGLDWNHIESAGLFGDGAAALIVQKSPLESNKKIVSSLFKTYTAGVSLCQIRGGGSLNHPSKVDKDYTRYGMFEMQGKELYRNVAKVILPFCNELLAAANMSLKQIDWVIPHQASGLALRHFIKKLQINPDKVINLLSSRGNQIAVSLPSGLHELLQSNKARSGDKILMLGTSAGLSLGGIILEL